MLELMPHTPTDMLDLDMPDLDMLDLDTTVMLSVLTTLARDLLTPMLKLNHGWLMLTTDMPDTHMPELMELTHTPMVLVITDTLLEVLTSSARDLLKLKLSPKPGMVLMDMVLIHTLMVDMDTHTLMVDIMDTESRLVNFYNSIKN